MTTFQTEQIMKQDSREYIVPACRIYLQESECSFCASLNGTHEGFNEQNLTEEDGYGWN